MKNRMVLVSSIAVLCLVAVTLFGFKNTAPNYQHLMIVSEGVNLQKVFVSIDGKEYIRNTDLNAENKGNWDINPVINLIHRYESEGWVLQSASPNNGTVLYWLRREK